MSCIIFLLDSVPLKLWKSNPFLTTRVGRNSAGMPALKGWAGNLDSRCWDEGSHKQQSNRSYPGKQGDGQRNRQINHEAQVSMGVSGWKLWFSNCGPLTNSISINLEPVKTCKSSGPILDLLNQKLWEWDPVISVLISPPRWFWHTLDFRTTLISHVTSACSVGCN